MITLVIDEIATTVPDGTTILDAAQKAGIYIPQICSHPDLPPVEQLKPAEAIYRNGKRLDNKSPHLQYEGCQLCVVQVKGKEGFHRACCTEVAEGMIVHTDTPEVQESRRNQIMFLLAKHPHACLLCAQKEGCARFPCSMNIPEKERGCSKFGNCEFQSVVEYIGIKPATPRYVFENIPVEDEPLFERDYNLCIGCTRCIRACRDVRGIEAIDFVFDEEGRVVVGSVGRTLRESACRFCSACVEVCPTGALMDKEPYKEVPCQSACPAGINIPRYLRAIAQGKYGEAVAVIREKIPFPAVCGYVCVHFCEAKCRRGQLEEAIAIKELKRFAADHDTGEWKKFAKIAPPTGKKVAIVGSGPAGLTAAYYLARLGHEATVFEALPVAGGMMRVGIPSYRLPLEVLDEEIKEIENVGVEIKTNSRVESLDELFEQGYQAIFVGVGAHQGTNMGIEGETTPGVVDGVDFLKEVNLGKNTEVGAKVLVVGGGNVAIDASRTALRLGAKEVTIVYRRTRTEMLASEEEIEEALEEGVKIEYLVNPTRVMSGAGKLRVECIRMELGKVDESGRRRPAPIEGSEFTGEYDLMVKATGQESVVPDKYGLEVERGGRIKVDPETLASSREGVYAGGDVASGPASIIEAIASGRKAAESIDRYLGGAGDIAESLLPQDTPSQYLGRVEGFADIKRLVAPYRSPLPQYAGLSRAVPPLFPEVAQAEAGRCLQCDLRLLFTKPIMAPKKEELWVEFTEENIKQVPETEGVYQLLDETKNVIYIKGAMNLQRELTEQMKLKEKARYFMYVAEPMYTKKESELLQQYLAKYGEMPEGNRELDDLF